MANFRYTIIPDGKHPAILSFGCFTHMPMSGKRQGDCFKHLPSLQFFFVPIARPRMLACVYATSPFSLIRATALQSFRMFVCQQPSPPKLRRSLLHSLASLCLYPICICYLCKLKYFTIATFHHGAFLCQNCCIMPLGRADCITALALAP